MKKSILIIALCVMIISSADAQDMFMGGINNNFSNNRFSRDSSHTKVINKKWSLNTYAGISSAFATWKGGYATTFAVPMGVQLNRMINNNVFAFAGLSVAPAYINLHQNFMNTDFSKGGFNNNTLRSNNFGIYQRAEIGLGYANDARTFQITGSVGIERQPNNYRYLNPNPNERSTWSEVGSMMPSGQLFQPGKR